MGAIKLTYTTGPVLRLVADGHCVEIMGASGPPGRTVHPSLHRLEVRGLRPILGVRPQLADREA